MKTNQHTPGPWIACKGDAGQRINIECKGAHNDLRPVATLKGPDREANAQLIASAPDLLAKLQAIVDNPDMADGEEPRRLIAEARAAIAKATGLESEVSK